MRPRYIPRRSACNEAAIAARLAEEAKLGPEVVAAQTAALNAWLRRAHEAHRAWLRDQSRQPAGVGNEIDAAVKTGP
jgi:hypothetical protein